MKKLLLAGVALAHSGPDSSNLCVPGAFGHRAGLQRAVAQFVVVADRTAVGPAECGGMEQHGLAVGKCLRTGARRRGLGVRS